MWRNPKKTINGTIVKKRLLLTVAFLLWFFCPLLLFAQVEITEIMYNPGEDSSDSSADGGREWVEIYNSGAKSVDLDGWKLIEKKDGGHPFSLIRGSFILQPKEFLVIADLDRIVDKTEDDKSTFFTDYPDYSGTILNANFVSLVNTYDTLILSDSENEIDRVDYNKEQGANDNGDSLQKIDGDWVATAPTPGEANSSTVTKTTNPDPEPQPDAPQSDTTTTAPSYKVEPQVFADILPFQNQPITGADFLFEGTSRGLQGKPLKNAYYQWTFGDGSKAKGEKVLHAYFYPGKYMVVLQVISGKYVGTERRTVEVLPADIFISQINTAKGNQFIELANPSNYELNLSWWRIKIDNNYYTLPKNTIILPQTNVKLSANVLGCSLSSNSSVSLLYPNGSAVCSYDATASPEPKIVQPPPSPVPPVSQTASIQKSIPEKELTKVSVVAEDEDVSPQEKQAEQEDLPLAVATTSQISQTQTKTTEEGHSFLNKWSLALLALIFLAILGIVFVNKLDQQISVK